MAVALVALVKAAFIADSIRLVEIDTVSGYDSVGRHLNYWNEICNKKYSFLIWT